MYIMWLIVCRSFPDTSLVQAIVAVHWHHGDVLMLNMFFF